MKTNLHLRGVETKHCVLYQSNRYQSNRYQPINPQEACAVFEEALQSHPSPAMYDAAVGFGMARLQSMRQAEGKPARKVAALLLQWTSAVCADAQGKGVVEGGGGGMECLCSFFLLPFVSHCVLFPLPFVQCAV